MLIVSARCVPSRRTASSPLPWRRSRGPAAEQPPASAAVTTVAEIYAQPATAFNVDRPLSWTGILTLADAGRNLLVVQDETGAIALWTDARDTLPKPGQRITLRASARAPFIANRPEYPFQPAMQDSQAAFEEPDDTMT